MRRSTAKKCKNRILFSNGRCKPAHIILKANSCRDYNIVCYRLTRNAFKTVSLMSSVVWFRSMPLDSTSQQQPLISSHLQQNLPALTRVFDSFCCNIRHGKTFMQTLISQPALTSASLYMSASE